MLCPLSEISALSEREWDHMWEYEDNQAFGEPSKLFRIGAVETIGGIVILNYNSFPEPGILWLWRDMGDELRDEGDHSFDDLVHRLRDLQNIGRGSAEG